MVTHPRAHPANDRRGGGRDGPPWRLDRRLVIVAGVLVAACRRAGRRAGDRAGREWADRLPALCGPEPHQRKRSWLPRAMARRATANHGPGQGERRRRLPGMAPAAASSLFSAAESTPAASTSSTRTAAACGVSTTAAGTSRRGAPKTTTRRSARRHALRSTARSATSATTRSATPASTACVSTARASARSTYPRRAPPWTSTPSGRRTASRSFSSATTPPPSRPARRPFSVIKAHGTARRRVTPYRIKAGDGPHWSPDGSQILFRSPEVCDSSPPTGGRPPPASAYACAGGRVGGQARHACCGRHAGVRDADSTTPAHACEAEDPRARVTVVPRPRRSSRSRCLRASRLPVVHETGSDAALLVIVRWEIQIWWRWTRAASR
jgi:hypothetical protein